MNSHPTFNNTHQGKINKNNLSETNSSHLKVDCWKVKSPFGMAYFQGQTVCFGECICFKDFSFVHPEAWEDDPILRHIFKRPPFISHRIHVYNIYLITFPLGSCGHFSRNVGK